MERPSKVEYYLDIALAVSKRSTCNKRHYGCVIVKRNKIVATGYNGSPKDEQNCCDTGTCFREEEARAKQHYGYQNCPAVHAEQNALISASAEELFQATLYLACEEFQNGEWVEDPTPIPCNICSGMIKNARIYKVRNRGGEVCL